MQKKLPFISLVLFCALTLDSRAAFGVLGDTTDWIPITPANSSRVADPFDDTQSNSHELDIVGTSANPGFYVQFWDGGDDTSLIDGELAFRFRIDGAKKTNEFSKYVFVGMDLTGDGVLDIFAEAGNDSIALRDAGTGANDGPSTTSIARTETFQYTSISGTNFAWEAVTSSNDSAGTSTDVDGDAGNDFFVSFLIPFADLVAAANLLGIDANYNDTKSISYIGMTATQDNSLNGDFTGLNKAEAQFQA